MQITREASSTGVGAARQAAWLGGLSAALGRDHACVHAIPNGRRTLGVAPPHRHPQRLRRPGVPVGSHRSALALLLSEQGVEILAPDAVDVFDFRGGEEAALDPVADRLRGQMDLRGDLLDREDFSAGGQRLRHMKTKLAKRA